MSPPVNLATTGRIGTGRVGAGYIGGSRVNPAPYFEQAAFMGDLGSTCGTIRTDGLVAATVASLPTADNDSLFPVAADATNAHLSPYTGTQGRDETLDAVDAYAASYARDKAFRHTIR